MKARTWVGMGLAAALGALTYQQVRNGNAQRLISKIKHEDMMEDLEDMI